MNFLTRFSLKNAVAVFIISFLLIVGGVYAFTKLKVELLPSIEFPQISIEAVYPGASPQDVNDQVTSKLEEKLKSVEGLKAQKSTSFESVSLINLEFPFNSDMDKVEQQVNSLIEDANLPENVQVEVNRFSFGTFPIYNISVFGKNGEDIQKKLEDTVIPELKKIPGINNISVGGIKEEFVQITIDKEKLSALGLSLSQVKEQINSKYLSFPAGRVTEGDIEIPVRVEEKLATIDELKNLELKGNTFATSPSGPPSGNGSQAAKKVYLKDVAKIETVVEQAEKTRFNQKDALSMAVTKKQEANTVEVANKVLDVLNKYDDEISYQIGFDSADGINKSVETLIKEGLLGALFASISVLLFLKNIRATIIAIISIPLSLLIGTIFIAQFDISLNIMTLGGMAVAVGRVVDDSIVVIENIFRRVRKSKDGMSDQLILDSTKEILKAITSSTITTVVVFLPLGLVGGITSKFFLPFALTIVFSLLASLIVAITIVPILAKFSFKKVPAEEKETIFERAYVKSIKVALRMKTTVIIGSILLLVGSFAIVPQLGFTFIPNEEQKTLVGAIELPASTSLEKTNDVSLKIEQYLADRKDVKEVTTGVGSRDFQTGLKRENRVSYFINLKDGTNVSETIKELEKDMESIVTTEAEGTKIGIQELASGGPPSNNNVDIDLFSNDLEALQKAAIDVENYMKENDDLKYVTNNFSEKQKQLIVNIDQQKATDLGISGFQILGTISDQTKPVSVGNLKLDGKDQAVQLSYDKELESVQEVKDVTLFTATGPIKLSEVADVKVIDNFTSIQKLDEKVYARISAQVKGDDTRAVTTSVIEGVKKDIKLPEGVSFTGGGGSDETLSIFKDLGIAILVAIGLVYITMLITFGQARIPFIILTSLLFVPIGALFGLWVAGEPLSVSAMIGLLMLIGIVTTNAIVLVDRVGQNREEKGMTVRDALIEAGKTRLRPIIMTAFATVAALIPLALTTSSGTLISKGLAITVIGGLTSSTLLTLIFIPVVYELFFYRTIKREKLQQTSSINS